MSVLIKGMSSYGCCADCEFCGGLMIPADIYVCDCPPTRGMDITRAIEEDCKHPDCQLVELPEKHGRLIDADAFVEYLRESVKSVEAFAPQMAMALEAAIRDLEDPKRTPTIVKAEGEEEGNERLDRETSGN